MYSNEKKKLLYLFHSFKITTRKCSILLIYIYTSDIYKICTRNVTQKLLKLSYAYVIESKQVRNKQTKNTFFKQAKKILV